MTLLAVVSPADRPTRALLIASLGLNLFVIGAAGALLARHYVAPPAPLASERPRTAAARIERLAVTLPAADAATLRAAFQDRAGAVEGARDALNRAYDHTRAMLRRDAFDPAALRGAMAASREARIRYELALHDVIAAAAAAMSPAGRDRLADWGRPSRPKEGAR